MRVGLVCPYSFDAPGGVQNHVRDLASVLRVAGNTVSVLAPGGASAPEPGFRSAGPAVAVPYNGSVARVTFGPRARQRTRQWLNDGAFDVVHVHEPFTPSIALLALAAADVPVVATFHAANSRSRVVSSFGGLIRGAAHKIAASIAVSATARQTLERYLETDPVVIPNGIFCGTFREPAPSARVVGAAPTVTFLGRADEPRKGLGTLLDAFATVAVRHPRARLLVAGRGSRTVRMSTVPAVRSRLVDVGVVSDRERARLFAETDVFVAPNLRGESFGVVLVEAMASRTAVVASDLPAFSDVLGHGRFGALFPVGDPARCADAVSGLLDDEDRREALAAAGFAAAQGFDWSVVAPRITSVYDSVRLAGDRADAVR